MRGALDVGATDAPVPVPLGSLLPGIYLENDPVSLMFVEALDNVLAPIWMTLDCIDSYLDPRLAPADFLRWLSTWVGLAADGNWDLITRRRLVLEAHELFRWWGTLEGLTALITASEGVTPQIIENGYVTVSLTPGAPPPPDAAAVVTVIVPGRRTAAETTRLEQLIRSAVPPHLTVEVRSS